MRVYIIASLLAGQLPFVVGCSSPHSHTKSKLPPVDKFALQFVSHIDRDDVDADVQILLDLASNDAIFGESSLAHQSALAKARKKESLASSKTIFAFVFAFHDCSFEETSTDPTYCGTAWLEVVVCNECNTVIGASLSQAKL